VRRNDGVFVFVAGGAELVEISEEFVDLRFGEVGVVAGVFDFEGVVVIASACHYVGEGVEAWVADWDADGVVAFLLEEFY